MLVQYSIGYASLFSNIRISINYGILENFIFSIQILMCVQKTVYCVIYKSETQLFFRTRARTVHFGIRLNTGKSNIQHPLPPRWLETLISSMVCLTIRNIFNYLFFPMVYNLKHTMTKNKIKMRCCLTQKVTNAHRNQNAKESDWDICTRWSSKESFNRTSACVCVCVCACVKIVFFYSERVYF